MNQLTPFERSLLAQFEALANASTTSLEASEATSKQLRALSETVRTRLDKIESKQREIERFQTRLLQALNAQTEQTEDETECHAAGDAGPDPRRCNQTTSKFLGDIFVEVGQGVVGADEPQEHGDGAQIEIPSDAHSARH